MKCERCGVELDETKRIDVPSPDWIDVHATPCFECRTITLEVPGLDLAQFATWAREHFGFDGS